MLQDAAQKKGQWLSPRLQELQKDKTRCWPLTQKSLLSCDEKQHLLAGLPSLLDEEKSVESSSRPPRSREPVLLLTTLSTRKSITGSLFMLLDSLQG